MTLAALFPAPVSLSPSGEDPLIDTIKSFRAQVEHFCANLTHIVDEYVDDTLYDAMQLQDSANELEILISILSKRHAGFLERKQEVINNCQAAGHTREGNLKIVSKESQGRRSVDRVLLLKERPDVYQVLLNSKIEAVKVDYTPTIADLKTILKKRHEVYLKPGEITVTYDIEIILKEDGNDN